MADQDELNKLIRTPAWLVQYKPYSAEDLRARWDEAAEGIDFPETPHVGRRIDEMRVGDFVLFWVSGSDDTAGGFAWGNVSGEPSEHDYPADWNDPDGPVVQKPGLEVLIADVFDEPFVTRAALKAIPEFEDFDVFGMPNASNVFRVTSAQWEILFHRLANRSE